VKVKILEAVQILEALNSPSFLELLFNQIFRSESQDFGGGPDFRGAKFAVLFGNLNSPPYLIEEKRFILFFLFD